MENWIGIGIWIILGVAIGQAMKMVVRLPDASEGHSVVLGVLGAYAAVIGGMLGVGTFEFYEPDALSLGGMAGAIGFAALMTGVYRWGVKGWL